MGNLFDIQSTLSFNADRLTLGEEYDYVTRTSLNQGVLQTTGFVNKENINPAGTWSLGLLQMDFFYRNKPWYAGQFVRKIVPKITIPNGAKLFFQTILNMQKHALLQVLVRNVDETFDNIKIQLPQTADGKIDFAFMEEFVRELEESRLRELEAYLLATGLNDYQLSEVDRSALRSFKNICWQEFRVGDLFDRISTVKLNYKAKELPQQPIGDYTLPCLTSSFMNQGLNYYAPRKGATILNNVISIPSNSDVYRAYYQSRDFTVLSDAYAIKWIYDTTEITSKQYLFMVACINKVTDLPIYSYKNKLGGWNVVKDKYISLPATAVGQPDLSVMEELITAMQKIAITDVAKFTAQRLEAPQQNAESSNIITIYDEYHEGCIPLYTLRAACGYFEDGEVPEEEGWVDATGNGFTPDPKRHFIVHAKGDSMFPKIKNGDFCIFEWYLRQNGRIGSREGEIVLAQCSEFDADYDGKYTIKKYHSEKVVTEDNWYHTKIELQPINEDPKYSTLEFGINESDCVIGIFVCAL